MACPTFEAGRYEDKQFIYCVLLISICYSRSEEEVLVSRIIEKALRRSRAIDTEGLCIVAGEKVNFDRPLNVSM